MSMIDFLTTKSVSGDLCINRAVQHLDQHEWGLARRAVEEGLAKGHLTEPDRARELLRDIYRRLGIEGNLGSTVIARPRAAVIARPKAAATS